MRILTELLTRNVDNDRFVQLTSPFIYESDLLAKWGLKSRVVIPTGFVQDFESIPIVRGRNKRGGTCHDFFSCFDSVPVVTKWQAADLYSEMNEYTDAIDHGRGLWTKAYDWIRRSSKAGVVRIWPGFFHKRSVYATCKEIAGVDGDPYVTIEKVEAIIKKTEQVSADLKDADVKVPETAVLIKQTDNITSELKDIKVEAEEKLTGNHLFIKFPESPIP